MAELASMLLNNVGIKGIRYLDGSSRGLNGVKLSWRSPQDQARYGTDMALDFADLELSRAKGDTAKAIKALKAEHKRSGNPSARDAAEALEQGAIISKPNAAYNYVLFDDSLVKIIEENGEARYSLASQNTAAPATNFLQDSPIGQRAAKMLAGHAVETLPEAERFGVPDVKRFSGNARKPVLKAVREMADAAYANKGGHPFTGKPLSDMLEPDTVFDVLFHEGKSVAFNIVKPTKEGLKTTLTGTDGSLEGKDLWKKYFEQHFQPGYYVEASDSVEKHASRVKAPMVSNAEAGRVLGKSIRPDADGFHYEREILISGLPETHRKVIFGLPWSLQNTAKPTSLPTSSTSTRTPAEQSQQSQANTTNSLPAQGPTSPIKSASTDSQQTQGTSAGDSIAPSDTPVSPGTPTPEASPESTGPDAGLRKEALERALGDLPPIMRKVWTDLLAGKNVDDVAKAAGISVGGVENIIRIVRGKAIALQSVADPARASQVNPNNGRPDLALSTNPMVNAVDAARNLEGSPGYRPRDLVVGEAEARLAANYDGTFQELLSKARKLEPMSDTDVAAVKLILAREAVAGRLDTTERRMALAELIFGYREIGSATARSLAMRFDPHHNPADRAAQYLAEALLSPDPKTSKSITKAKSAEGRQAIMKAWLRRVDGIKTAMRREGVDADALLKQHQAVQQAITRADDLNPDAARVYRIQIGRLSPQDRAILETARALQVAGQRDMRIVMSRAAAAGAVPIEYAVRRYKQFQAELANEMEAVALQAARVAAQRAVAPGAPGVTSSEMEILADIGFGSLDDYFDDNGAALPDKKVRKNKNRAAKKQPAGSARQYEPVPGATPPTGQADQEQIPGMDNAPPPAQPPQPPPDIFGDYDLTDPVVLRKIANEFGQARGSAIDGLIEFWKASILSGPKTQVVNVLSTAAYGFYETFVRNTAEGALNSILKPIGLGSKDAASAGELAVILAHTHHAAKHAIFNALAAWRSESRIFNDQVLGLPAQLDFAQTKGEKAQRYVADPSTATGRLINLVMTAIRMPSFRLMGMADELLKTFYGHLNASAYAHREAKKAGLKGDAYKAEHARLMAYGSTAWVKARENALRISFQTELMEKNDAISVPFDLVAKGVQYSVGLFPPFQFIIPFIVTPTNLAKSAIELSPAGAFFHILAAGAGIGGRFAKPSGIGMYSGWTGDEVTDPKMVAALAETPEYAASAAIGEEIDVALGLSHESFESFGDWKTGGEPSITTHYDVDASYEDIRYAMAWKGLAHNQLAVLPFKAEPGGPAMMHVSELSNVPIEDARFALEKAGIQFRTIAPQAGGGIKIYVFDPDRSAMKKLENVDSTLNIEFTSYEGQGQFIEGDSRASARDEYLGVIAAYERQDHVPARISGGLRERLLGRNHVWDSLQGSPDTEIPNEELSPSDSVWRWLRERAEAIGWFVPARSTPRELPNEEAPPSVPDNAAGLLRAAMAEDAGPVAKALAEAMWTEDEALMRAKLRMVLARWLNPLFPALRSNPNAVSTARRQKQIPSSPTPFSPPPVL
jgi:hypothetical protein